MRHHDLVIQRVPDTGKADHDVPEPSPLGRRQAGDWDSIERPRTTIEEQLPADRRGFRVGGQPDDRVGPSTAVRSRGP